MSFEQRLEFGKSRRSVVRRINQGPWIPPLKRLDPIEILTQAHAQGSLEIVAIKMEQMTHSPFQFFKGAHALMAYDLSTTLNVGLRVQMCGDAHLLNLRADSLVFDFEDFAQSHVGPFEWDLKRLATSIAVAGDDAGETKQNCELALKSAVGAYRKSLVQFAIMDKAELARFEVKCAAGAEALPKLVSSTAKPTQLVKHSPIWTRTSADEEQRLSACLSQYKGSLTNDAQRVFERYRPAGTSFKVFGLGSLGIEDYVMPFFGNSIDEVLFLQFRPSMPSSFAPYVADAPNYKNHGQRVADGQRTLHTHDPFLGFSSIDDTHYMVRSFIRNYVLVNPLELRGPLLLELAQVSATVLAKAHARTSDAAMIVGYVGQGDKFDDAVTRFAMTYASQVTKDFELFLGAVHSGTIQAAQVL